MRRREVHSPAETDLTRMCCLAAGHENPRLFRRSSKEASALDPRLHALSPRLMEWNILFTWLNSYTTAPLRGVLGIMTTLFVALRHVFSRVPSIGAFSANLSPAHPSPAPAQPISSFPKLSIRSHKSGERIRRYHAVYIST